MVSLPKICLWINKRHSSSTNRFIGLLFALWVGQIQFSVDRGTPAPIIVTQKLII